MAILDTIKDLRVVMNRKGIKGIFRVSLYRNALYLIAASMINAMLGFVFWIVAAHYYTPEEVGLGSATISSVLLLSSFANLGLGYGLIRFLPKSINPVQMINTMLTTSILTSVAAASIFLAGLGVWSPALVFIRENPLYLGLFIIFTAVFTTTGLIDNAFIANRRSGFIVTKNLIFSVLKIIMAVVLAASLAAFGILSSWGIAAIVAVMVGLIWLLPRAVSGYYPWPVMNTGVLKETSRFVAGNYVYALLWGAPAQVLPLLIVNQLGATSNAHFYVAFSIAGLLFSVPTMAATSLFAEGSSDEKALGQHVGRSLKLAFIILVPAIIIVLLFASYLLLPFGANYSQEAANLLRILAVSALPLTVNITYLGTKQVEMKVRTMIIISCFTTILTIGLGFILIPRMGINGGGVAWVTGQGLMAIIIELEDVRKILKIQWFKKVRFRDTAK
jgi:O-antigen/teichoic acid export membrane protein